MPTTVLWFRRDLRLGDNPALGAAAATGDVLPLFVFDPALWEPAGPVRRAYLLASLRALNESLDGKLHVRHCASGQSVGQLLASVAAELAADTVHIAADYAPYGARRDAAAAKELAQTGRNLVRTGSPYAVAPGRVVKADGSAYRVYTPFYRAWCAHGWRGPAPASAVSWANLPGSMPLPSAPDLGALNLPTAGEQAALDRWDRFLDSGGLDQYGTDRNRPDRAGTSELSAALRWGEVHPRTLLAALNDSAGHETYRKELAWREFYADVLHQTPSSARESLRTDLRGIETDSGPAAESRLAAWQQGRTGFPIVDAGMRQLLAEGWMHNRVRMIVASFLIKDLHLEWQLGARWFMHLLRDGDVASNQHGWQWVAGTGTDASPYYRVFNPTLQGQKFDPQGDYVRRYLPELASISGAAVHEPWALPGGQPAGYPTPIVDHAAERHVALARYAATTKPPPVKD